MLQANNVTTMSIKLIVKIRKRKVWKFVLWMPICALIIYLYLGRSSRILEGHASCKQYAENEATWDLTCSSIDAFHPKRWSSRRRKTQILFYNMESWFPMNDVNNYMSKCTFGMCSLTTNRSFIKTADAILYVIPYGYSNLKQPPIQRKDRNPNQPWIFMVFESPFNTHADELSKPEWRNMFNWSMSYRLDSDIHLPYGCIAPNLQPTPTNYINIVSRKSKMAAWIVSNCNDDSRRLEFVRELKREGVEVDIYGACGTGKLTNESVLQQYKFYLALENSLCTDYVTEKFFERYNHDLILITLGGIAYNRYFPRGTFIDASAFRNISTLAKYILHVNGNDTKYMELLTSKNRFVTRGAHTYGRKYGFCKLCEMVRNYDQYRKSYYDIMDYIENRLCWSPNEMWNKNSTNCLSQQALRQYKHKKTGNVWNFLL